MAQEFKLPDLGEGVHEGEILEVPVAVGDHVEEDEVILTVETDKAAVDIPSPFAGEVREIHVEAGDIVRVGDVLLSIGDGEGEAAAPADERQEKDQDEDQKKDQKKKPAKDRSEAAPADQAEEAPEREAAATGNGHQRPVPASPDTRRVARELDVDLQQVSGSGPGGRVTREDVESFAEEGAPREREREEEREKAEKAAGPPDTTEAAPSAAPELPDFTLWGEVERQPLRSIRRATARRMAQSWSQIPHVTHHDRADVTELEKLRQQYREQQGLENLTPTAFVLKAAVAALKKYPRFNASLDTQANEIVIKHYYNIGVAVTTERGLIVPVIRAVERKSLAELADELAALVARVRAGEAGPEDMQGGTFTITNIGPIGGTDFEPIINYPQAAILGMARMDWEPVVRSSNGQRKVEPRLRLPLVLAFDHRLADGAEAARFVNDIVALLEDPDQFMLRV